MGITASEIREARPFRILDMKIELIAETLVGRLIGMLEENAKKRSKTTTDEMLIFFFKGSGAHRDLHSSPTRRFPDLAAVRPLNEPFGAAVNESVPLPLPAPGESVSHVASLAACHPHVPVVCAIVMVPWPPVKGTP